MENKTVLENFGQFTGFGYFPNLLTVNLEPTRMLFPEACTQGLGFFDTMCEECPKKRGRRRLRPNNPTKTEVMDKFWLRGFREFMKSYYSELKNFLASEEFWDEFLSRSGVPGKKGQYLSYSKAYKQYLFENKSFAKVFTAWAYCCGLTKVPRKNFKGNWENYYDYLFTELVESCKTKIEGEDFRDTAVLIGLLLRKYSSNLNYF